MPADNVRELFESVDTQPSAAFAESLLSRLRDQYVSAAHAQRLEAHGTTLDDEPVPIELVDEQPRDRNRFGRRPRRGRIAVAVAAAAALLAVAGVVVRSVSDDDVGVAAAPTTFPATTFPATTFPATTLPATTLPATTPTPPLPDGLAGLPPEGATPSTPATGQLLARLPVPIWVYEDGRVISAPWTSGSHWTGFLERRLTPEGLELVRAEILASEPFAECRAGLGVYGFADGERGVCDRPGDSPYVPFGASVPRLEELAYGAPSWLPSTAWLDPEPKPYVPSSYQMQFNTVVDDAGETPPLDVAAMRAAFPPDAAALLTAPEPCGFPAYGPLTVCFRLTTDEARTVAAAFGLEPAPHGEVLEGVFQGYWYDFVPYLPHDAPVWCCAG